MKKLKLTTAFLAIGLLLVSCISLAQEAPSSQKDYKNNPEWIKMMNDPSANYFETVKAFRTFFEDRFLPEEPWDRAQEGGDPFEKEVGLEVYDGSGKKSQKELDREAKTQDPNEPNYAEEVRAFKSWFYSIQPWVKSDGSIMSQVEQQAIIQKQQDELKEIEKINTKK